jgi:Rab3 GTPase-activating protein regulatory subunit N-terminus
VYRNISADSRFAIDKMFADDREVTGMCMAPGCSLAACGDDRGRIFLLDTANMCVIRAWKGYRSAQCAWVRAKSLPRVVAEQALFTVAPDSLLSAPEDAFDDREHNQDMAPLQRCDLT